MTVELRSLARLRALLEEALGIFVVLRSVLGYLFISNSVRLRGVVIAVNKVLITVEPERTNKIVKITLTIETGGETYSSFPLKKGGVRATSLAFSGLLQLLTSRMSFIVKHVRSSAG